MPTAEYDVIVIGGGVLGASITYHSAKRGLRALLLEKSEFLTGTSGATFAWVGSHVKKPASYNLFSQEAVRLYAGLEAELEDGIEYEVVGSIELVRTGEDLAQAREEVKTLREQGFNLEVLPYEDVKRKEPIVPPAFSGGIYCPSDAMVNPFSTVRAYLNKARRLGAEVRTRTEVVSILRTGGAVRGVVTPQGEFRADWVVSATGIHTPLIGEMIGVAVPMRRSRGNVLVTERAPRCINGVLGAGRGKADREFSMRQPLAGNILIGPTADDVTFDRSVTADNMFRLAQSAAAGLPALRNLSIIRAYGGVRPMPNDGLPIISEVAEVPGMILVVTHSGITLSVMIGRTVAAHVAGKDESEHFSHYGLERFASESQRAPVPTG